MPEARFERRGRAIDADERPGGLPASREHDRRHGGGEIERHTGVVAQVRRVEVLPAWSTTIAPICSAAAFRSGETSVRRAPPAGGPARTRPRPTLPPGSSAGAHSTRKRRDCRRDPATPGCPRSTSSRASRRSRRARRPCSSVLKRVDRSGWAARAIDSGILLLRAPRTCRARCGTRLTSNACDRRRVRRAGRWPASVQTSPKSLCTAGIYHSGCRARPERWIDRRQRAGRAGKSLLDGAFCRNMRGSTGRAGAGAGSPATPVRR